MVDQQEGLNQEASSVFLKKELTKLKEEKCVLVNRLFAVNKKYTHLKSVGDSDPAILEARQQDQLGHRQHGRPVQTKPGPYGH